MKTKFSKRYIISNRGCYSMEKVKALSFINNKKITINDFIESELPIKDKYWWLIYKCKLTNKEKVKIAVDLSEIILPIYENKYKSKKPRQDIELTAAYAIWAAAYADDASAYADNSKYLNQIKGYLNRFKI